jgi:hypothetical protein
MAAAAGRSLIQAAVAHASQKTSSALLQVLGTALAAIWTVGGQLASLPPMVVDKDGNPVGLPGPSRPDGGT